MSYTFSKESFSYILEKENAKKKRKKRKSAYILGNGTLLYFSKQKL